MKKRRDVVADLAAIGVALRNCGVFVGMRVGFVLPFVQADACYDFARKKPRALERNPDLCSAAILDLIDARFHASGILDADPAEARLAASDVPRSVERTEQDGLVTLRWAQSLTEKATLDRACEAHEDWLDRNFPDSEYAS